MARMILTIPGVEVTVTDVNRGNKDIIEIAARVTNWWRLLYWYIREYYEVPWYMWPYVLWIVGTHGLRGKLGLYDREEKT